MRVVVFENEPTDQEYFRSELTNAGCEVLLVSDADIAKQMASLKAFQPEYAVVDSALPTNKSDGFTVVTVLAKEFPGIVISVCSGFISKYLVEHYNQLGVTNVFGKNPRPTAEEVLRES